MQHAQKRIRPQTLWLATLIVAGIGLGTCATPTPYQPVGERYGYSDQQIETGRFKVSFSGNSLTDQETVENYLLFRAAEITVESGDDYFVVADRDTNEKTTYRASSSYYPHSHFHYSLFYHRYPFYGFGPYGRYGRYGGGYGFGYNYYSRPITRYTATADIVTYQGEKPRENASAYDARDVMRNLGPNIVRPEDIAA